MGPNTFIRVILSTNNLIGRFFKAIGVFQIVLTFSKAWAHAVSA